MKSEHFAIQELVPREIYEQRGKLAWQLLDPTAVNVLNQLRDTFGPLTVNTWLWGGNFTLSGFRPPKSSVGAALSQHRFGRAFDVKPSNTTVQEMYKAIREEEEGWRSKGLTTLENIDLTPTWLHFDVRWTGESDVILIVG